MRKIYYLKVLFFALIISCVDRYIIPNDIASQNNSQFGAGDTTYLQIKPVWDDTYGIEQPEDISIAQDGRVFVADRGNNSILVFDQNGERPEGYNRLTNIQDGEGAMLNPIDVDIDKKMNVFFIDGSQRIFLWNQYWSDITIAKVSKSAKFNHIASDVDTTVDAGSEVWLSLLNSQDWNMVSVQMDYDQAIIDSLMDPHLFYDGRDTMNIDLDIFYQTDSSKFNAITAPSDKENMVYVTDDFGGVNNQYRIIEIDFYRSLLLELANGDTVWSFMGRFGSTVKGFGTGAGTVNGPLGLDVDYQGNLYYTQVGDYFPAHMIIPNFSGDFAVYTSGFQPGADDIMEADRFSNAEDIAVDNNKNIYVVDNVNRDVTVFNSYGDFFKKVGYGQDSLKILAEPVAATVDQNGVLYVCDRSDGAIYRFRLSNELNEDIIQED
tara:strand:+ start:84 stop:1388 length:1305 start_codon:yes stop_codon:yes gene_type:complete